MSISMWNIISPTCFLVHLHFIRDICSFYFVLFRFDSKSPKGRRGKKQKRMESWQKQKKKTNENDDDAKNKNPNYYSASPITVESSKDGNCCKDLLSILIFFSFFQMTIYFCIFTNEFFPESSFFVSFFPQFTFLWSVIQHFFTSC